MDSVDRHEFGKVDGILKIKQYIAWVSCGILFVFVLVSVLQIALSYYSFFPTWFGKALRIIEVDLLPVAEFWVLSRGFDYMAKGWRGIARSWALAHLMSYIPRLIVVLVNEAQGKLYSATPDGVEVFIYRCCLITILTIILYVTGRRREELRRLASPLLPAHD